MSETTHAPAVATPPEVSAFAAEKKVEAYLPVMVGLAHRYFPLADLSVALEEDPEVEGLRHIVVCARAVPITVEEALAAKAKYRRAAAEHVPAPLLCLFRLGLELAS